MKKPIRLTLALGYLTTGLAIGQTNGPLQIQWQKSFGGTGNDTPRVVQLTSDGGYLLLGTSTSPVSASPEQGTKTSPHQGDRDVWLVRLDPNGNPLWDAAYGGKSWDVGEGMIQLADGGCLLAGVSTSGANGTKTTPNRRSASSSTINDFQDYWLVRVDREGRQLWDKALGTDLKDFCYGIVSDSQGGFVLNGWSDGGVNGDRTAPGLGEDYWLLALDARGNPIWDKTFGGTSMDIGLGLQPARDGGYLLGGISTSATSGNKTSPLYGDLDGWYIRVDAKGNKLWDVSLGGSSGDWGMCSLPVADGGFLIGLSSSSAAAQGNKTSPCFGMSDYWIVRINSDGVPLWDKSFGGPGDDYLSTVCAMPDGGFLLVGSSNSKPGGNKTAPHYGLHDFWLVRVDVDGNKLWDQAFGGGGADNGDLNYLTHLINVTLTPDGGFLLAGASGSLPSGTKTSPSFGGLDFWVLKLDAEPPYVRAGAMQADGLPLTIIGPTSRTYVIQGASDCSTGSPAWTDLATVTNITGQVQWIDPQACNASTRFYRAVRQ